MGENKEKQQHRASQDSGVTVSTIEAGGAAADEVELRSKDVEYFEKALELTKFGLFNYFVIVISGMILANVLLETLGISFVLPVSQCDLHLSIQEKGILSAIGFVGIITSSHLWGFLADTTGRRTVMRPTLIVGFIITVISSFSTNFWLLVVTRFINGFCISGGSAVVYAYLGEFHTTKTRSRAIMGAAFIFGIGAMMLPAIAWLVINQEWSFVVPLLNITYKPWRCFMIVCGIPGLICGLALFTIPESPKFLLSHGNEDKTVKILEKMYSWNTGNDKDSYPIKNVLEDIDPSMRPKITVKSTNPASALLRSMWDQTSPLFNREYIRTTVIVCMIQFWTFVTSNGMYMWFPDILNSLAEFQKENPGNSTTICDVVYAKQRNVYHQHLEVVHQHPEVCSEKLEISTYQYSLTLELMYALGFAFIGAVINRISGIKILFIILSVCGICGIAAVYVNIPTIAIYLYLIFLLCGLAVNVLSASTVELYPTRLRAMAVCISLMMGRLGSVVGANIVGALLSNYCHTAFLGSGVTLILAGFLGFLIPKPTKGNTDAPHRASLVSMTGN